MLRRTMLVALAGAFALSGCSLPTVDKEADAKARALYEQIRTGADLGQNADLAPELKAPETLAQLAAIKASLPPGAPTAVANRSWSFNAGTGGTRASLVHAYTYPSATVLAETVLTKGKDKVWKIAGFHVGFAGPDAQPKAAPPVSVEKKDI